MTKTKAVLPVAIISIVEVASMSVIEFNNGFFDVRLCASHLEDNISTICVKDEHAEWYVRREGTKEQILAELAKFLPDGYTVGDFMAAVEAAKVDTEPELVIVAEGESDVIVRG